jgi:Resolvase, N terminal domain
VTRQAKLRFAESLRGNDGVSGAGFISWTDKAPYGQLQFPVAIARGWRIVEEFIDNGVSGAKGRDKRPGFDHLLKAATLRQIDVVAAWSPSLRPSWTPPPPGRGGYQI